MSLDRIDALSRRLADSTSRRRLLKVLGAGAAGTMVSIVGLNEVMAKGSKTITATSLKNIPIRAGDNGQLSKRKIEIDAFEVILARTADFNAAVFSRRSDAVFCPVPRTHRRQSFHAMRSANFSGKIRAITRCPGRNRRSSHARQKNRRPASGFESPGEVLALLLQFVWHDAA